MRNNALRADSAEMCLIGALLRRGSIPPGIDMISPDSFFLPDARRAYEACQRLNADNVKIELVTVDEMIEAAYGDPKANTSFLLQCLREAPHAQADLYAPIVHQAALRRRTHQIAEQLAEAARDSMHDLMAATSAAQSELKGIDMHASYWEQTGDVLLDAYSFTEARAEGKITPIASGIQTLDRLIGGFFPDELTIIGARPGVGKTAFALQVALSGSLNNHRICFVSAEMGAAQVGLRVLSNAAKINAQRLRLAEVRDEDWDRLSNVVQDYSQLPISWMFRTRFIEDIAAEARRKAELGECDLLLVDYIQLLQTRKRFEKDYLRVGYIGKTLKWLTKDLHIPVVALAQVSRDSSGRCPVMKDLRDSGELEQDADNIIFLHRPSDIEDPYVRDEDKSIYRSLCGEGGQYQYIVMNVDKQRQGQTGVCAALFNPSRSAFLGTQSVMKP